MGHLTNKQINKYKKINDEHASGLASSLPLDIHHYLIGTSWLQLSFQKPETVSFTLCASLASVVKSHAC